MAAANPTGGATSNFQFQCPTCGALLQALLRQELTSVQCGECFDVFDVQMPARCNLQFSRARIREISTPRAPCPDPRRFPAPRARAGPRRLPSPRSAGAAPNVTPSASAAAAPSSSGAAPDDASAEPPAKRQNTGGEASGGGGEGDESTAMNLESSLQSCTAHRERILQMLVDEPENANLIELRDQLTNAINQLQGTRDMVQRAQGSAPPGGLANPSSAAAAVQPLGPGQKAHSSRKNKPQRCSVCGGLGHKSRTCNMAAQQQHPAAQQQMAQVQWAAAGAAGGMMPGMPGAPGMAPPGMTPNAAGMAAMHNAQMQMQQAQQAAMQHHQAHAAAQAAAQAAAGFTAVNGGAPPAAAPVAAAPEGAFDVAAAAAPVDAAASFLGGAEAVPAEVPAEAAPAAPVEAVPEVKPELADAAGEAVPVADALTAGA